MDGAIGAPPGADLDHVIDGDLDAVGQCGPATTCSAYSRQKPPANHKLIRPEYSDTRLTAHQLSGLSPTAGRFSRETSRTGS